jgi:hypothetical protein
MNTKITFLSIFVLVFTFLPEFLFAQGLFDDDSNPSLIDIYLVFLVLIGVIYTSYQYYKSDNLPKKRNKNETSIFKNQSH